MTGSSARIGLSAVALGVLAWAVCGHAVARDADPIGFVKTVESPAFIESGDVASSPRPGAPVYPNDRLRTGPGGAMGVTLRDGTRLALGSETAFVVESYMFEPQRGLLGFIGRLLNGDAVYSSGDIGRLAPETIEFHVPGGMIGVRGTRFAARAP